VDSDQPEQKNRMQRFRDGFVGLNIGFAITSSLFIYDNAHHLAAAPRTVRECLEGFSRALGHVASLALHQQKKVNLLRSELIREAVFLGLTLGIAFFLYFLTRLLTRSSTGRTLYAPLSGVAALFAVPACWLYIVHATWSIYEPKTFVDSYGLASILELTIVSVLVYFVRNQPIRRGAIVFGLHYIFWMLLMFRHLFSPFGGGAAFLGFSRFWHHLAAL
jgi:hypothetical protein